MSGPRWKKNGEISPLGNTAALPMLLLYTLNTDVGLEFCGVCVCERERERECVSVCVYVENKYI